MRGRGVADGDVTAITRRADGNPLLALLASGAAPASGANPVADAFLALPADHVEVLGVAGLLGRTVDIVLLEHVMSRRAADLSVILHEAVGAGLLDGGDPLAFVHDLVREAAEETLPPHRRVVLHAAAATALQRRGDLLGAIDHVLHGFGALDADDAVEAIVAGCEQLAERLAFEDLLAVASAGCTPSSSPINGAGHVTRQPRSCCSPGPTSSWAMCRGTRTRPSLRGASPKTVAPTCCSSRPP